MEGDKLRQRHGKCHSGSTEAHGVWREVPTGCSPGGLSEASVRAVSRKRCYQAQVQTMKSVCKREQHVPGPCCGGGGVSGLKNAWKVTCENGGQGLRLQRT